MPDEETEVEPFLVRGELRGDCPPIELQRRLGTLRRRAKEWQQEQGLNVLFLATGFLRWVDQDGEKAESPLLLLPCELERNSPRDAFVLKAADDDFTLNATLAVKLQEFGLGLPEEESDFGTAEGYLNWIRELVASRSDWEVTEDLYLATFAYSKLAMWRDLGIIKNNGTDHPVVLTLAGASPSVPRDRTPSAVAHTLPEDLSGGGLDDVLDVRDQYAVLPADYSQLLAIRTAKSGSNLVVHGPPGTGKSQTISNMIATFMAEGKSVLFVSEKTAALDVVKRRLEEKELGVFCLDLHSERGKKANVYQQLRMSVDEPRTIKRMTFDYAALSQRRNQLNQVVRLTHQTRQPFGRTLFQVQGRFAELHSAPHDPFDVDNIGALEPTHLAEMLEAASGIRLRSREFREHTSSHWHILKSIAAPIEMANRIRQDMNNLISAVQKIQSLAPDIAEPLGLNMSVSLDEVLLQERIGRHFTSAPSVPREWFEDGAIGRLKTNAELQSRVQEERTELIQHLDDSFGTPNPDLDFEHLRETLMIPSEEELSLVALLGERWDKRIRKGRQTSFELGKFSDALGQIRKIGVEISDYLSLNEPDRLPDLFLQQELVQTIAKVGPIPLDWSEIGGAELVAADVEQARLLARELDERESQLFSKLEPHVMNVVDYDMLVRYRTDHQSRFRRLTGSNYRSDRKAIQGAQRTPEKMSLSDQLNAVAEINELQNRLEAWEDFAEQLASALGRRFRGRDSDWESILIDIEDTRKLLADSPVDRSSLVRLLTDDGAFLHSQEIVRRFGDVSSEFHNSTVNVLTPDLSTETLNGDVSFFTLENIVQEGLVIIEKIEDAVDHALSIASPGISDLSELLAPIQSGVRLAELERNQLDAVSRLEADYKDRFEGFETNWSDVLSSLDWANDLVEMMPSEWFLSELLANAEKPLPHKSYEDLTNNSANALSEFRSETLVLDENYDLDAAPWGELNQSYFDEIVRGADVLAKDADSASDWLAYLAAVQRLDQLIGSDTTESIRLRTDDSEFVPQIVERRVLGAWLDWVYQQEPLLSDFSPIGHEDLITRFKEIDQLLEVAAQIEVRKKVFERYPNMRSRTESDEENGRQRGDMGILRGELSKSRRQRPVRGLFRTIPRLIQNIKPCFFMSPLAVSQYLPFSADPSNSLSFDVVIFDEASQVHPEDAVPAILRANQLILAGDQKQLPPSNFWRRSLDDDDSGNDDLDENESDQLAGRKSILDASVGLVGPIFTEEYLNVHYRSQDESLIRFSNHHFYGDRLLTFPSSGANGTWLGVHDEYVPDGRYDAGGTRTNRIEAERVVDLVFEHMRTRPIGESLGVVALSRPQADLIEQLVDERRILERDTDDRFDENPEEPFFVKNLENVQGDERDHIIISIGYGPTVGSGAVPNRFGPLNNEGGERRLNVVVTRAKHRVDLVHSLRANDIRSRQAGARLLRRYLEYAENPLQAFEAQATVDDAAESESPFESAVEAALLSKGYKVARQVGVSGYRIDLAISSEDGSRFVLGIECDGWTYHSAPAARDRDWLRQQVLEGLGWKIHRVWSTAWVRNPEGELARIEEALATARFRQIAPTQDSRPRPIESLEQISEPGLSEREVVPPLIPDMELEEYEQSKIPNAPSWAELGSETTQNLIGLIRQIAEAEGPVHRDVVIDRLRKAYGLGRVKGSTREHVQYAISDAISRDVVKGDLQFVWSNDSQLSRSPRKAPDSNIEHISPTELKIIVLTTAKILFGSTQKELVVETARKLGFNHTGKRITEVLDDIIQKLLLDGKLQESFGNIHPGEKS